MSDSSFVAAILDVDNTLVPRASVERMFMRYLWNRGELRYLDLFRTIRSFLVDGHGPLAVRIRTSKIYLSGRPVRAMEEMAAAFVASEVRPVVSPKAMTALEDHRRQGHRLVLLTGCPGFLVRPLAQDLGIDSVIAARLEERDGRWTGRLIPPHPYGMAKRVLLESWAQLEKVRLDQSHAYADSPADRSVFEAVGHPQVVNPGRTMKRLAADRGWPVLDW